LATGFFDFGRKENYMCLSYVYTSNKTIRCFFFTVVVKIESLVKYYQGSLKGFMETYYPLCNQDISVRVYMAGNDVYDLLEDLIENGLKMGEDFVYFDATDLAFDIECTWRKNLSLGVGWLRGRRSNKIGDICVWYNDNYKDEIG
jgi:hypothetical protein